MKPPGVVFLSQFHFPCFIADQNLHCSYIIDCDVSGTSEIRCCKCPTPPMKAEFQSGIIDITFDMLMFGGLGSIYSFCI